ncbi:MAG: YdeI/OmpD-associated family protein [Sphingobacteriia bacterium]|nr:YdeI/OmpD-associated family protein [Sphingobacteriia bacterium]
MSNQTLFEKLQLQDEKNLLIQGLPSSIEKQFAKLSYAKNVTPLLKTKKIDFALVFAVNQNQLVNIMKEVFAALHDKSKLWVAYPKQTSKIVSDLNRDSSWEILTNNNFEGVTLVALDHVWSAMRFQKTGCTRIVEEICSEETVLVEEIAFEKKSVTAPAELEKVFTKHQHVREFFTSLSSSNQNEYVTWIQGAKKEETRKRRLEAAVEKLMAGKKTPLEK